MKKLLMVSMLCCFLAGQSFAATHLLSRTAKAGYRVASTSVHAAYKAVKTVAKEIL